MTEYVSMRDSLDMTVHDDLADLAVIAAAVEALLADHAIAPENAFQINLCLDELITNSVRHGAVDGVPVTVNVHIGVEPTGIRIRLTDNGRAYDPFSAPVPDLDAGIDERPIGGLGVHFVRSFMEEIGYQRDGGRNIVSMLKRPDREP